MKLRSRFVRRCTIGAALSIVAGAAAAVGFPLWQVSEARTIVADGALWQSGTPAVESKVAGRETHHYILASYELDADYTDQEGRPRHGTVKFDTLVASVDQHAPLEIRYDPRAPDRFVLSWEHDLAGARWAAAVFMGLVGLGLGLLFIWVGRLTMRRVSDARLAAVESDEVELELVRVVEMTKGGRRTGQIKYRYRVPTRSGKLAEREVLYDRRKQEVPLFADPGKTRLLALRSPRVPDRPIVLRSDLYPFAVPGWDAQTVAAEVERYARQRAT